MTAGPASTPPAAGSPPRRPLDAARPARDAARVPRSALAWPDFLDARDPAQREEVDLAVAFRDCDPMGILWHGNYLAYCEAAREALGARIGFGIARMVALGVQAPVVRSQVVHLRGVAPGARLRVSVSLYPTPQPRMYHRYQLAVDGAVCAIAETDQVLQRRSDGALLLTQPPELARALGRSGA